MKLLEKFLINLKKIAMEKRLADDLKADDFSDSGIESGDKSQI